MDCWPTASTVRPVYSRRPRVILTFILLLTVQTDRRGSAVTSPSNSDSHGTSGSGPDEVDTDLDDVSALEQLSRVFDVGHVSEYSRQRRRNFHEDDEHRQPAARHRGRHRSPPEYMVDLYNTIAYTDGISKTAAPYEADVVRGIPDRAGTQQVFYYFNVSHIDATDQILEAELRLFRLRPAPEVRRTLRRRYGGRRFRYITDVKLYEVLRPGAQAPSPGETAGDDDGLRLLQRRRISVRRPGWEVFKLRNVLQRWVVDPSSNLGLLLTATTLDGVAVNGSLVRFAQRSEHHDSKQPVLVVFSERTPHSLQHTADDTENIADEEFEPPTVADSSLRAMRRNYIRFLNEAYRAEHGNEAQGHVTVGRRRPSTHYMSPSAHQRLVNDTGPGRDRRSPTRRRRRTCQRHEMYVDFEKIGWAGWIISPKGYNAYQCRGVCPFPLGQNQHPSNHATVQSIVHALRIGGGNGLGEDGISAPVDTPCCVPNKLYSISLLYFDDDENVILKQYDEMVALNCGCH